MKKNCCNCHKKAKTPKGVWPISSDKFTEEVFAWFPTKLTNETWIWLRSFNQEYQFNAFVDGNMWKDVYKKWI